MKREIDTASHSPVMMPTMSPMTLSTVEISPSNVWKTAFSSPWMAEKKVLKMPTIRCQMLPMTPRMALGGREGGFHQSRVLVSGISMTATSSHLYCAVDDVSNALKDGCHDDGDG
jgi:hypothetical protein